jgi:hypothetical protein
VPVRFPRPIAALVAVGTAAVIVGMSAAPARADQVRQQEWWLSALSITNAWTASEGSGVTIAVLSDGVDASQPDLTGVVTAAPAPVGAPVATGQFFGEQGTPIASLIAGHGDGAGGGSGIIGVAPAARILSVPVTLPPDDAQLYQTSVAAAIPSAIAAGIRYAVSHRASVIDLPIDPGQPGNDGFGGAAAAAGGSAAESSAVSYAVAHNVVLVAPAGDDGLATDAPNYPAAYPGVIAVGAFDSAFDKAPWTSHQSYVTLTAAGAGVIAASSSGGYETMNSTSAASAVVAGIVALIRSRYPSLSAAGVLKALITTTMYHHADGLTDGSGYGAVNAAAALGAAATLATPAKDLAGAGAQPHATPGPATAGAGAPKISPQIVRAGEISAGVLVLLLLAVAGYAARRRRRTGPVQAFAAEWTTGQTQSRYPHALVTPAVADRMQEYFGVPTAPSHQSRAQLALPGRPTRAALSRPPDDAGEEIFRAPATTGDVNRGRDPHGPVSSLVTRRAAVSGTPPWEPASPPEGGLPWSDTPGKQLVPGQVVASAPAAEQPAPGDPDPRPGRLDWRRVAGPGLDQVGDGQPVRDERASRTTPTAGRHAPSPSERHAAHDRPSRRAPAAWSGPTERGPSAGGEETPTPLASRLARADPDTGEGADTIPPGLHASGQHRSGLPIRQPRSVGRPPLSPTGSLWEPAGGGGSLWERADADTQADAGSVETRPDTGTRPIFVWEPPGLAAESQPRRSGD